MKNTKNNNVHKFLLDAKINTTKTIIVIIFFVIVTSLILYYFLRVPEITTILQNQPANEWIPSLFKVGIEPALILAIVFLAIKLVLRIAIIIFVVVYLPIYIYVVVKRFINYLIITYHNKIVQKILTTNEKLEEVYSGPANKLLECLGINDNPMWQVKKQMLENYYENDKKFINLNQIDYSGCENFNHLFDGLENIPMRNFSKLRCYLSRTDENGKNNIVANKISSSPTIIKNIFLNKNTCQQWCRDPHSKVIEENYYAKELGNSEIDAYEPLVEHNKEILVRWLQEKKDIATLQIPMAFELFRKTYPDFQSIYPYQEEFNWNEIDVEWVVEKMLFKVLFGMNEEQVAKAVYDFVGLSSFPLCENTSSYTPDEALTKVLKQMKVC